MKTLILFLSFVLTSSAFAEESPLHWFRKGSVQDLGEHCENFIQNIETRRSQIAPKISLQYANFTYRWQTSEDGWVSNPRPGLDSKFVCSVEIQSSVPVVLEKGESLSHVCDESVLSSLLCKHSSKECETLRQQAAQEENVLDATIYEESSPFTGVSCQIVKAKLKF
ncbi:MAG TPA: hypothetical protein VN132_02545 [Bdellovibrio sp.]|nr:hypothetical protein [Bdellovibrio sp.]